MLNDIYIKIMTVFAVVDTVAYSSLHAGKFDMLFCRLLIFFAKSRFLKISFRNIIRVSNSLDPDQA